MDLPHVGVMPSQTPPIWEQILHRMLWIVRYIFLMEMVEDKDHPSQLPEKWSKLEKMTGLLMHILSFYFMMG